MDARLRPIATADIDACARVMYEAFRSIADPHGFTPPFTSVEGATNVVKMLVDSSAGHGIVAEEDGRVVGAVFVAEGDPIRAIALIGVDPRRQGRGIGRQLMRAALDRVRDAPGVRLIQEAFNAASLSLYASLGFEVKEPLALVKGKLSVDPTLALRRLTAGDLPACAALYAHVHGVERTADLRDALKAFAPFAAVRDGRVVAYTYRMYGGGLAWGVAETEDDMKALLAGIGKTIPEPLSFLVPVRQASFFQWCLGSGLRVEKPMTLMARGWYQEPRGPWFPSGFY